MLSDIVCEVVFITRRTTAAVCYSSFISCTVSHPYGQSLTRFRKEVVSVLIAVMSLAYKAKSKPYSRFSISLHEWVVRQLLSKSSCVPSQSASGIVSDR